jgi:hypothetical protein
LVCVCIDADQRTRPVSQVAHGAEVDTEPGGEVDVAHRDQAGGRPDRRLDVFQLVAAGAHRHPDQPHPTVAQRPPRVHVGREVPVEHDDLVARLPGQPVGH